MREEADETQEERERRDKLGAERNPVYQISR